MCRRYNVICSCRFGRNAARRAAKAYGTEEKFLAYLMLPEYWLMMESKLPMASSDKSILFSFLSAIIKKIPISIHSSFSMDEAISTSGGIHTNELNENFELKKRTTIFCIGEMVNWNAPTGGYLLQGCFSMGVKTAHYLNTL